jgi:hypothetical protein
MSDSIQSRLSAFFGARSAEGVLSAYLFGSHARGAAHRQSDVDVAVLVDRSVYPTRGARDRLRVELAAELIHVLRNNEVDVVCLQDVPPELGRRIVTEGAPVFCADRAADHAFRRDVQLRAADVEPFLRQMRARLLAALRS